MRHPDKWRETCDPFALGYHAFRPLEVLGYPYAGNDVFHMRGIWEGREVTAYVKAARQKEAAIANEVAVLRQLRDGCCPTVIDFDVAERPFSVTLAMPGERLSTVVGENKDLISLEYMEVYGAALAKLHRLTIPARPVRDRRFFHAPPDELLKKLGLMDLKERLLRPPGNPVTCFCHGDFHYANVLWEGHRISGILDFELAGYGDRDFDIAWAVFLRPGQRFLQTEAELEAFLRGYESVGCCDRERVRFYMARCYIWFLGICGEDERYCAFVRQKLKKWSEMK